MRSRRGLRTQREPGVFPVRRTHFLVPRTVVARGQSPSARHCASCDSCELVRAFPSALGSAQGRRGRDASDRLLHSETIQTRAPVSIAASQRCDPSSARMPFGGRSGITLVPSLAARARSRETSLSALPLLSPHSRWRVRTREAGHRATRVTRCERGWGESRFTTRPPLRRPSERLTRALSSLDRDRSDRL
jgi:hypothetical protein